MTALGVPELPGRRGVRSQRLRQRVELEPGAALVLDQPVLPKRRTRDVGRGDSVEGAFSVGRGERRDLRGRQVRIRPHRGRRHGTRTGDPAIHLHRVAPERQVPLHRSLRIGDLDDPASVRERNVNESRG